MIRTAIFKLHNPSRRKRAVLDYAFKHYTVGLQAALALAERNLDWLTEKSLRNGRLAEKSLESAIAKLFSENKFKLPLHSSLRDSMIVELGGMVGSYIGLGLSGRQKTTDFPRSRPFHGREELHNAALEGLRLSTTKEEEDAHRDTLALLKTGDVMPLHFSRSDGGSKKRTRDFGLMKNPETGRYSALLFLLAGASSRGKPLIERPGRLVNVRTPSEPFAPSEKLRSAIICPLAFGDWHLSAFIENGDPKTAILCRRDGEYFLHVSFQLPGPEPLQTETLLGVDRGIANLAAMAVVTPDGRRVLERGAASGAQLARVQTELLRRRQEKQKKGRTLTAKDRKAGRFAKNAIHEAANSIVDMALAHRAQVVVEDLRGMRLPALMPRQQYAKLLGVLGYKLQAVGLPAPREVRGAYTSQTCSACGSVSSEHRLTQADFACTECGHAENADVNAAVNIARKLLWLDCRNRESKEGLPEEERTTWPSFARQICSSSSAVRRSRDAERGN